MKPDMRFGASEDEKAAAMRYMLDDYDWQQAVSEDVIEANAISMDRVSEVLGYSNGENDGRDWIAVFRFDDGQFAFLAAGRDYTGWDCQSGGTVKYDTDLDRLIRMGMTLEERERLGCTLDGDADLRGAVE